MKPRWTSLAAGLWSGSAGILDWPRLREAALERDLLGPVDLKLIGAVAARAGRADDEPLRVVLGCLLATVRMGGLRLPAEPVLLAERLERFLRDLHAGSALAGPEDRAQGFAAAATPDLHELARALAEDFHRERLAGTYAAVLGDPGDFKPLLHSGRGLYFQKHQAAEALAGMRLAALLAAPDRPTDADTERNVLDTVLRRFPMRAGRTTDARPLEFSAGQARALSLGLRRRLLVVSGGPGTGKTSLVANLLRALVRLPAAVPRPPTPAPGPSEALPLRIRLAAPTGRAAQRLTESLRMGLSSVAYSGPTGPLPGADTEAALDLRLAGLAGETLHRLLRYQPGRGDYHHRRGRPIPADLVVVDEASMVDIFSLARLLDALEEGASLILLGDMDQLPSVEAGAVLADLVPRAGEETSPLADRLVLLDRSHRSSAGILDVTRGVNAQDGEAALAAMAPPFPLEEGRTPWPIAYQEDGRKVVPGGGCRFLLPARAPNPAARNSGHHGGHPVPPETAGQETHGTGLSTLLRAWVDFHYLGNLQDPARHPGRALAAPRRAAYGDLVARLSAAPLPDPEELAGVRTSPWGDDLDEAFAWVDQARILTFTRKGWHGSFSVNRRVRDLLAPAWDPQGGMPGSEAFNGAPVMVQENDYSRDLFNGEVGILLRLKGRYLAFFRKEEGYRLYPAPMLPRHELAFASTVHKAQGSEYDQVLLILPEAGNRLLFKETLYTALTRARYFAALYGPPEVFLEAVGRKVLRESGLRDYLRSTPTD